MKESLRPILATLHDQFGFLYGARLRRLVLFGSQARDEADAGSDIDVLIVLEGPVDPGEEVTRTGALTAALSLEHDVVLSCTFVSSRRFDTEQSPLLLNIRREGVSILGAVARVLILDHPVPCAEEARTIRQRLRGSAKGSRLVEKLLADRKWDG